MNPNRMKVLEMLSQGKISLEEAEQLLAKLDRPREEEFELETYEMDDPGADIGDDAGEDSDPGAGVRRQVRVEINPETIGERAAEFGERIAARVREKIERKFGRDRAGHPRRESTPPGDRAVPDHPRFLRVLVESHTGDRVNVRVPIALIKTGMALTALVPESAREAIEDTGMDFSALSKLDPEELVAALAALTVDVESHVGDKVQVFCE